MIEHDADVLVLGGGPAGAWAALAAAGAGARVVLADKGYCGTSGPTASGGNNLWYVPPDAAERERAVEERFEQSARLADRRWMARELDETYRRVDDLVSFGYPFPVHDGVERRGSLRSPEYMRRMRRRVHRSGARILDHHPALRLLADGSGAVAGASGIARQRGGEPWTVRAGAVVLATGGCAFLSGAFGANVELLPAAGQGRDRPVDVHRAPGGGGVIEVVSADRCVRCDVCVRVCPTDALYVAPFSGPAPDGSPHADEAALDDAFGEYRRIVGWGHGRTPGSRADRNHVFTERIRSSP